MVSNGSIRSSPAALLTFPSIPIAPNPLGAIAPGLGWRVLMLEPDWEVVALQQAGPQNGCCRSTEVETAQLDSSRPKTAEVDALNLANRLTAKHTRLSRPRCRLRADVALWVHPLGRQQPHECGASSHHKPGSRARCSTLAIHVRRTGQRGVNTLRVLTISSYSQHWSRPIPAPGPIGLLTGSAGVDLDFTGIYDLALRYRFGEREAAIARARASTA